MDEILIGDKKYISSKQAAKVTGYAKDYVGQLCREGRVPARLVGRGWYVLESAIQDHRFGASMLKEEDIADKHASEPLSKTWEAPRYESATGEALPSLHQSREDEKGRIPDDSVQGLQDSWQAWFSYIGKAPGEAKVESGIIPQKEPELEEEVQISKDVPVPIHAVRELSFKRILSTMDAPEIIQDKHDVTPRRYSKGKKVFKAIQLTAVLLAVIFVVIALAGSGYFDAYLISSGQDQIMAGVSVYNK